MRTSTSHATQALALSSPLVAIAILLSAASADAQSVDNRLWGTNGRVATVVPLGNRLDIGGSFSAVGPCTGSGAPVDTRAGAPQRPFPRVSGAVSAAISDGAGGWLIGGTFTAVEGIPRSNLAHVLADGRLSSWGPSVVGVGGYVADPNPNFRSAGVYALALVGHTL